jgi:hypothetical protein
MAFVSSWANARAMRSVPLPADHGTMNRIGREGYCANVAPAKVIRKAIPTT